VDGGITNIVSDNLFELSPHDGDEFRMMFAGGVNHWNHIQALLDFMARNRDSNLRLWIAGAGAQVKLVKDAAANDRRIVFYGQLERDALFKLYAQADVLLNLRDMGDPALAYHFPSKLLEMLVMGKPVITSSTNHAKESYGHICKVIDKIEQLDEAVGELRKMTADERCEYGKRARVWMLANKTWRAQGPTIREYLIKI
jgi:glycosyltransferase involved in cell wall biosynthesis